MTHRAIERRNFLSFGNKGPNFDGILVDGDKSVWVVIEKRHVRAFLVQLITGGNKDLTFAFAHVP